MSNLDLSPRFANGNRHSALVSFPRFLAARAGVLPGLALCGLVTLAAFAIEAVEQRLFGRAWLEALVLAIVIGTAVRTLWTPGARWHGGITFSAKTLLEVAVMLLGASISFRTLADIGPGLLFGIAGVVATVIRGQLHDRSPVSAFPSAWRSWSPAGIPSAATRQSPP